MLVSPRMRLLGLLGQSAGILNSFPAPANEPDFT